MIDQLSKILQLAKAFNFNQILKNLGDRRFTSSTSVNICVQYIHP